MVAPGGLGHVGVVGDQHDGATAAVQLVEQAHHVAGRHRVEVAGRLVGQDQVGVGHQGPGHGHPLLLAAGQLAGPVVDPVGQADPLERREGPALALGPLDPGVEQRELDVAPAPTATPGG